MNLSVWESIMKFSFIFAVAFFIGTVIVIIKFNLNYSPSAIAV